MERTQTHALSFFKRLGFSLEDSGPYLKIIYGRPYLNLTLIRHLMEQSGLQPAGLLWIIGHAEAPSQFGASYAIDWQQAWAARRAVATVLWHGLRAKTWFGRSERISYAVRRSLAATDWSNPLPADLLNRFRLRIQLTNQLIETEFVLAAATVLAVTLAARALAAVSDNAEQTVRKMASLGIETSSTRQGRALLKLAEIARGDEAVRRYLSNPGDGFRGYRKALANTLFLAVFDEFMAGHGGGATFESDPGWPRYGEDTPSLLATAMEIAGAEVLPNPEATDGQRRREEAQVWAGLEPDRGLGKWLPWRRWLARQAIASLHHLAQVRDQLRTAHGRAITACRAWDLNLAERWCAHHWLAEPEDYFWLTMEEVERGLMAESEVGPTLPALVRARRETYQTYAATEMPYVLRELDVARLAPGHGLVGTALSSVLSGLPVSPGQVQGRVIVLRRLEEADRMQDGAILVTPSTDLTWFPTFLRARGLIVETGGLLSHGSIIAREFGLPAVANISQATNRFHDGDLVLLDGGTGLVQILESVTEAEAAG